ncbi:MAG TPA: hypothetical protein DEA08_08260, partial [Planctomycetes bacterium]|nr:hypothetical protein [Planctomycetota bacterium]
MYGRPDALPRLVSLDAAGYARFGRGEMDELERLREQVGALQREVVRLRNPSQRLWSRRDVVWNQIEETLGLGTWTWDVAAQAVDWSPGLYRILGFDPEVTPVSEAAKVFDEHIHPEDLEAYLEGQERALGGDTSTPSRFRFRRPDGEVIHCLLLYTAVKDAAGEALSFAGAILDVTERVAAEREMVRKGRLEVIGRLAGSVAHDFNNLLMVVLGNAELLQLEQGESEGLGQIQAAAKAGSSLTRQLLSFSATRQGSAPVTGSLRRLVDDAIPMIKRLLREDISVFVEHESGDDLVRVDPGQLQASVVNLAVNARDAMPRGGKLSFRTRTERLPLPEQGVAECVVLSVIDSGVGMSSETLELIFEPFFTTK